MTAKLNVVFAEALSADVDLSRHAGHGFPLRSACNFGWFDACAAANIPVGKISPSSISELSAIDFCTSVRPASLRLNKVPPACGTRMYWACAPCSAGDPKSKLLLHRQVKPSRQTLRRTTLSV